MTYTASVFALIFTLYLQLIFMEVSALFTPLWRQKWHIVSITLVVTILMVVYSLYVAQPSYQSNIFFTIGYRDEYVPVEDYNYGNYYGNFASIEFARTLSAWPKDTFFIDDVYKRAGVDRFQDEALIDKLIGNFNVKREERANVIVNVRSKSESNLQKLTSSFIKIMKERLDTYNNQVSTNYQMVNLNTTYFSTFLALDEAWPLGIMLGLLLSIVWVFIYEAWLGVINTNKQMEEIFDKPTFWLKKGLDNNVNPILSLVENANRTTLVSNRAETKALKNALAKNKGIHIASASTKKTGHSVQIVNFPKDSSNLLDNQSPVIVVAERGKSRIHELKTLKTLLGSRETYTVLL